MYSAFSAVHRLCSILIIHKPGVTFGVRKSDDHASDEFCRMVLVETWSDRYSGIGVHEFITVRRGPQLYHAHLGGSQSGRFLVDSDF